jgi:1-acyl-sn-glycerol-3-phosphate acyltransferase
MEHTLRQLLRFDPIYRTDFKRISPLERLTPTFSFYTRFLSVVFRASSKAKKGRYDDAEWYQSSLATLRALERVGVHFEISGLEHLERLDTPCVVVANHMSVLETTILPMILLPVKRVTFIVKESLINYPVFKHILRSRHPIVVNRTNARQDLKTVMREGVDRLRKGISVIVFPQTTRTHAFDPKKFNSMGVKLASRAKVPVVPLALLTDAWGNGRLIKEFGKIDVSRTVRFAFGRPIWVEERAGAVHREIIGFVGRNLKHWRSLTGPTKAQ